jgi:hypothetical protein
VRSEHLTDAVAALSLALTPAEIAMQEAPHVWQGVSGF